MPKKAKYESRIYFKVHMKNIAAALGSPREVDVIATLPTEAITKATEIFCDPKGEWDWKRPDIEFEKCENMGTIYL
jgi:hypothetical protein